MKVVFLTAGAAGMFCGSCMHDNALAKSLRGIGVDCLLQPIYTPIRTDETSIAGKHLFFGGVQIYLLQVLPWMRFVPARARRLLDWPPLVRLASRRAGATDAAVLGDLAISMLRGTHGNQRDEVVRVVDWLADEIKPDAVVLSNLLIGGMLPALKQRMPGTRVAVILQGDDIFLEHLPERQRTEAIGLCGGLQSHVDVFVTNSKFYADKMGAMIGIDRQRIEIVPLSIDVTPFRYPLAVDPTRPATFRLGYLARISPEKGLHRLVEGFLRLARESSNRDITLEVAGWLGESNRRYFDSLVTKIRDAGLSDRFTYHGSPDLSGKVQFLRSLDLLCVPTEYQDPKGLFVLEALAANVCVAMPNHGAFGELIAQTGGGLTFDPTDMDAMCSVIQRLKDDWEWRRSLAATGRDHVLNNHTIEIAASTMKRLLGQKTL